MYLKELGKKLIKKILTPVILLIVIFSASLNAQYQNVKISASGSSHNEVSIALNVKSPNYLSAGANTTYFYSSSNAGLTWSQKNISSNIFGVWGDPSLIYDRLGNLYYGHLSNTPSPGYWIDRIVVQKSTDNGITFNQGAGIGFHSPKEQDKEWLGVDMQDTPYKDYVYVTWTEFDQYGSFSSLDSSRILFSRSTDYGLTWLSPVKVSDRSGNCVDEDDTDEGAVPTVGPNGEVYVSWSGPVGLMFDRSFDGGLTWGTDINVSEQPGGWDFSIPGIYRCNGMPITACDTSRTYTRGNIYICWGDQRNGSDNSDVWFSKSTDGGTTWSPDKKVNNDNTTRHQFFPWMAIDQVTGHIHIVFYDRRETSGTATDVYLASSNDGGENFNNYKVSATSFTPNQGTFFGDYTNIASFNRKVYPIWMRGDGSIMSAWIAIVNDSSSITPVELKDFSAVVNGNKISIKWETITETNNLRFEIERRSDDPESKWISVGNVNGKGTTTEPASYYFTDAPLSRGIYYYRLKQSDFNGTVKYSNEIQVQFLNEYNFSLNQNYPNPFNPSTTIGYQIPAEGHVVIKIFDMLGNEVKTVLSEDKPAGLHEITFKASELASGMYIYRMISGNYIESRKMLLLK